MGTGRESRHTLFAGIRLHELVRRTGLLEFRRQPCQLREDFVDESHFGRQLVLVDVEGEEAADVAWKEIRVDLSVRLDLLSGGIERCGTISWVGRTHLTRR